jgi:hypothetical protein
VKRYIFLGGHNGLFFTTQEAPPLAPTPQTHPPASGTHVAHAVEAKGTRW